MADLLPSPDTNAGSLTPSDEELRSWYGDLFSLVESEGYGPHVPPPVEPDIELLREAYEEFRQEESQLGTEKHGDRTSDHTAGQSLRHRALHRCGGGH